MTESELELIKAFENLPEFVPPVTEYRIYYNPVTKECTYKTTGNDEGDYIVVDRDTYEDVIFSPNYLIRNGKPELKPVDYSASILLSLSMTGQRTMRDYPVFVVDDDYTGDVDIWARKE